MINGGDRDMMPPGEPASPDDEQSPRIPSERFDLKILQFLRQIMRAVDAHSRRLFVTHEVTGPQLICLMTVAQHGPLTLKALAGRVFLSSSTVVGILDRLEARGLVLRVRDTRDRRLVQVTSTIKGQELVRDAPSPLQEGLAAALLRLTEIEQATIALSLQRIVELMEVGVLDASPVLDTKSSLTQDSIHDVVTEEKVRTEDPGRLRS